MKKRYELTLSATDGMCCIYDISCEPKELVKAVRCHFIRIFSIQPETNEFHVQVEFGTWKTFQHDADVIVELEKAPCVKRVIPMNTKGLPEVFFLTQQQTGYLCIREDIAETSYGPEEFTGTVNTDAPMENTCSPTSISRQVSIGLLAVTVRDEISNLGMMILTMGTRYNALADKLKAQRSLAEARNVFKHMEDILMDAETLAKVWATGDVEKIQSFDTRTLKTWKYSAEAWAMGVPKCGDIRYGIVKVGFHLEVIKICISEVNGKNIEFVSAEIGKKPSGYASTVYTVATDEWKGIIFDDEAKAKAHLEAMKMHG